MPPSKWPFRCSRLASRTTTAVLNQEVATMLGHVQEFGLFEKFWHDERLFNEKNEDVHLLIQRLMAVFCRYLVRFFKRKTEFLRICEGVKPFT